MISFALKISIFFLCFLVAFELWVYYFPEESPKQVVIQSIGEE